MTPAELEARRKGLGASDAAAACRSSSWKTQHDLWLQKKGRGGVPELEEVRKQEKIQLLVGNAMEPVALELFEERTGLACSDRQRKFVDPAWDKRWVTVDAMASDGGYVEAKSTGMRSKEWGHDEYEKNAVPQDYLFQIQHGLGCNGAPHAWVPLVVLNRTFHLYIVERLDDVIEMTREVEQGFWKMVEEDIAPKPQNLHDVRVMYPKSDGGEIMATPEVYLASRQHGGLKDVIKRLKKREEELELVVKSYMGNHSELVYKAPLEKKPKLLNTWRLARGGFKLDDEKLGLDQPVLYKKYLKATPGTRRLLTKD